MIQEVCVLHFRLKEGLKGWRHISTVGPHGRIKQAHIHPLRQEKIIHRLALRPRAVTFWRGEPGFTVHF